MSKRKFFRIIWFSLVTIFMIWQWMAFQSHNLPDNVFDTDTGLAVETRNDYYTFKPRNSASNLEIIFFQGGLTDPKAYAPLCRKIAEKGFTCHLMRMPFRLPVKGYEKIKELFDLSASHYAIGGHSQGGKMAAQFVFENPALMKGLFLMGTSHPRDIDLSGLEIPTAKIYAENDGLASMGEVMENKSKLPANARLIFIEGGNHSQFGYLGHLLGDDDAAIPLEQQQEQTLEALLTLFAEIESEL
nr:alpha/beta hydrolase [Fulvivirga imtechensis]